MRSIEQIIYTLTKDQYLEFITYQVGRITSIRRYKMATTWSFPAAMVILSLILKNLTYQWIIFMVCISLIWLYLSTILWIKKIIPKTVEKSYNQLNIKEYTKTVLSFEINGITIQGNNPVKILKSDIEHCVFLKDVIIIYYNKNKVLLIPQNALNKESNVMKFLTDLT